MGQISWPLTDVNNRRNGYTLNVRSNGAAHFWGGTDGEDVNYNLISPGSIGDGFWHHMGVRANSDALLELLVDGVVVDSLIYGNSTSVSTASFPNDHIGSSRPTVGGDGISTVNSSDLLIDEVRVYSNYLDDTAWMAAMAGSGTPDQLYYDFEGLADPNAAPTPTGLALLALGIAGMGARRGRCFG